jgi:hypothetical protein
MAGVKTQYYVILNTRRGETFDGVLFQSLTVNGVVLNLNGYLIEADFRKTKSGTLQQRWTTALPAPRITILQPPTDGSFKFNDDFKVDLPPATYFYDIRFTAPTGRVEYYVEGTLTVEENVTREGT